MEKADLYLNSINYSKYFSDKECRKCGSDSCKALIEKLRSSGTVRDLPNYGACQVLKACVEAEKSLPEVPKLQLPRTGDIGLTELNSPSDGAPVLVTGNNQFTQEVLLSVLSGTSAPFFLLFTDTNGDTLDMAVLLDSFTAERVQQAIVAASLSGKAPGSPLIIPGKAADFKNGIQEVTSRHVNVGPVCAAELPLYFVDRWHNAG